ncbi:MAG: NAD-dependent protein deacylase [Candidatus Ancillula sp.]|nr:NAD-dependent protein deacylase [Candidatus Ancillula sp.]
MSTKVDELQNILARSKRTVFFGGAGVSTESGLKDFRSVDGLYNEKYAFAPEVILSNTFFRTKTKEFFEFYRDKMILTTAQPNPTHLYLARNQIPVITQNIDGLHSLAVAHVKGAEVNYGTPVDDTIYELHGSIHRNYCTKCHKFYPLSKIIESAGETDGIPRCTRLVDADGEIQQRKCNAVVKPDVVLYEETLHQEVWGAAEQALSQADTLIVGGTSLTVYPAASLVSMFRGGTLVLINRDETAFTSVADLVISEPIGQVFAGL